MKIVVDAMGSDHAPVPDVAGAVQAAKDLGVEVILVGPQAVVEAELAKHDRIGAQITIVHAPEVVKMEEHTLAVKSKKDSSMVIGMQLVRRGEADAFVSAGNSGAVMAAALFHLGRLKGVLRPALAAIYPTVHGRCVVLDVGANTDCKPEYLIQFALMGRMYAERALGIPRPRIGILSNGEEEGKGSTLVRETYDLLKNSDHNFVGNVEGKDVPLGLADVVVTDGFTGNVVVKLSEGLVMAIAKMIKRTLTGSWRAKLALALMLPGAILLLPGIYVLWPGIKGLMERLSPDEVGGAPLLGVRGPVIIGHGRSNAAAIRNAVRAAVRAVEGDMIVAIREGLAQAVPVPEPARLSTPTSDES